MSTDPQKGDTLPQRGDIVDVAAIVRQLEDLVKLSVECESKELRPDVSFIEVNKKLMAIRKQVESFQENYRRHLAMANLKPEDIKPTEEEIATLGPKEKQILERLKNLQESCEDARERLHVSLQSEQEALNVVKGELKDKSKEKIHRKGKFKGVGGKRGWLPT